jgi:hypothetical protein
MTTSPNNPSNRPQQQNGYNPITLEDVRSSEQSSGRDYFGELSDPVARCVAVPLLGFIFFFSLRMPLMAPLLILVLLGCLLARLDGRPRQIAAVPLTMAAIKLAFQMGQRMTYQALNIPPYQRGATQETAFAWLPIFFSVCLVFIPKRDSITFKMVLVGACLLLASGLLPGEGFVVIYCMLNGLLFVGIVAGLIADIKAYYQAQPALRPMP